ncbi:Transcriptional regulator, LysR family [hydrothermal vent metagenome]|uniref:Transcriptional regulator, LysR family n=1 Tax=hydrothermal vent metagenome TaxID=652676 RepID=A0A3B0WHH6_9ZZZZ
MDWNALKLFLAIADNGTLTEAAKVLEVNHSTVFRRLNAFENEIGGRLFERLNHGYELTAMGEDLLIEAKKIADSFNDMERRIVGKDIQPKGIVKITAPNNIAYRYLSRYLTEFGQLYPDIRIELLISNLEFNMTNRQADIAVRATPAPPEHLVGRKVRSIQWSVYTSRIYHDKNGSPKNINQLKGHELLSATGMMKNLPAYLWLEKKYPQQIKVRCDELTAMAAFVEAGCGLAILPDDQQRPEIIKLFTFNPGESSGLWLLTHPDLRHVERIKLVMQHLAKSFSKEEIL